MQQTKRGTRMIIDCYTRLQQVVRQNIPLKLVLIDLLIQWYHRAPAV